MGILRNKLASLTTYCQCSFPELTQVQNSNFFSNYVGTKVRRFWPDVNKQNDQWLHLVLNFIGPNIGQGVQAFRDGIKRDTHTGGADGVDTTGPGQVVVGRRYINKNQDYAHVEVDELIFFNQVLSTEEISQLYNMY